MNNKNFFNLLLLLLLNLTLVAQPSFKDKYEHFYNKMRSAPYYSLSAQVDIYNKGEGAGITSVLFEVKMKDGAFFMKMGDTERIMNDEMVITANRDMQSIMLSERMDEDFDLLNSAEYFSVLDSISHTDLVQLLLEKGEQTIYAVKINNGIYKKMELVFIGDLLTKITTFYANEDAPYSHSILTLDFDLHNKPQNDFFTIERYAYISKGKYELKQEFKDFELSLY